MKNCIAHNQPNCMAIECRDSTTASESPSVMGCVQTNEEITCQQVAKIYSGKDWHKLSLEERKLVGDLVQAGWLDENKPANGFVGKAST